MRRSSGIVRGLVIAVVAVAIVLGPVLGLRSAPLATVSTVAELNGRIPAYNGETVLLLGYHVAGDHDPRFLTHVPTDTGATNRGNRFRGRSDTGTYLARDATNAVQDLRWWGGKPDNATDATAALQAALDAGVNGLYLPPGTAVISAPIVISRPAFRLEGPGALRESAILTNMIRVEAAGVQIKEITLIGAESTNTFDASLGFDRIGILSLNAPGTAAEAVTVTNKSTGMRFEAGSGWSVRKCTIGGFWSHLDYVSGINNGAGVVCRDSDGRVIDNTIVGTGQGICSLNRTNHLPVIVATGNNISRTGDNGIYLVVATRSVVQGNVVNDCRGTAYKVHGSGHVVSGNTATNCGLGIAVFPIHAVPAVGSDDYSYSTNKWGPGTTNWFHGSGNLVQGNTLVRCGRHGIDMGLSRILPNTHWSRNSRIAGNIIRDFGGDANDCGIRLSGDGMVVEGNILTGTSGTSSTFGVLFGGQAESDLGWRGLTIRNNQFTFAQDYVAHIQVTDASRVVIDRNTVENASSTLGIVAIGLTDLRMEGNILPDADIRLVTEPSTNVVLLSNKRRAVVKGAEPVGFVEIIVDETQMTVGPLRTPDASTSPTYHWSMTVATNAQRGLSVWNKHSGASALAAVQVITGTTNSVSGGITAVPEDSALSWAGRMLFHDNSDSAGLTINTALASNTVDVSVASLPMLKLSRPGSAGETGMNLYLYDSETAVRVKRDGTSGVLYTGTLSLPSGGGGGGGDYQPLDADLTVIAGAPGASNLVTGNDSTLHYHSADRSRANHTGTQPLATISDAGTAAARDVPTSGDASTNEVVLGSDSRLTNSRTPTSHTHPSSDISDSSVAGRALLTAANASAQRTELGLGTMALVNDAPSDGTPYVRSNAAWVPAPIGGGGGGGGIAGIQVSSQDSGEVSVPVTNLIFGGDPQQGIEWSVAEGFEPTTTLSVTLRAALLLVNGSNSPSATPWNLSAAPPLSVFAVGSNAIVSNTLPYTLLITNASDGIWTNNIGGKRISGWLWGGGGGGASGRRALTNTAGSGGGGGGAGGFVVFSIHITNNQTFVWTNGAGGSAGASQTTHSTSGNDGTDGSTTSWGSFRATGGGKGFGGNASVGAGGAPGIGSYNGGSGGAGAAAAASSATGNSTAYGNNSRAAGAGGGGGGINASGSTVGAGGNGGRGDGSNETTWAVPAGGSAFGQAGAAGASAWPLCVSGSGGGGGRPLQYGTAGSGGAGGAGGFPGGGGGGGASGTDATGVAGNASGAGGAGANGAIVVIVE